MLRDDDYDDDDIFSMFTVLSIDMQEQAEKKWVHKNLSFHGRLLIFNKSLFILPLHLMKIIKYMWSIGKDSKLRKMAQNSCTRQKNSFFFILLFFYIFIHTRSLTLYDSPLILETNLSAHNIIKCNLQH